MKKEDFPRPEYIRPFFRPLDGRWRLSRGEGVAEETISIPCFGEFGSAVFSKEFELTSGEANGGVLLSFIGVSGKAEIILNGAPIAFHSGSYSSFSIDISRAAKEGENTLSVKVSSTAKTAGIWGSVYLEFTGRAYFAGIRLFPPIKEKTIIIRGYIAGEVQGLSINAELSIGGEKLASYNYNAGNEFVISAPLPGNPHLWVPLDGRLYDVRVTLSNAAGGILDRIYTYCAFRNIKAAGTSLLINGEPFFLTQAAINPEDCRSLCGVGAAGAMKQQMLDAAALGFNGLYCQKFFPEPKLLYLADKLGLLLTVGAPDEASDLSSQEAATLARSEWTEIINRDFGHPSIVIWNLYEDYSGSAEELKRLVEAVRALDPTRPVIASSGGKQYGGDFYCPVIGAGENRISEILALRPNGGRMLTEKEEARIYKSDPALLPPAALARVPAIIGLKGFPIDSRTEKQFVGFYSKTLADICSAGGTGAVFYSLYDGRNNNGLYGALGERKLSREGAASLRAAHLKVKF